MEDNQLIIYDAPNKTKRKIIIVRETIQQNERTGTPHTHTCTHVLL